jgi:hypothetical protein
MQTERLTTLIFRNLEAMVVFDLGCFENVWKPAQGMVVTIVLAATRKLLCASPVLLRRPNTFLKGKDIR